MKRKMRHYTAHMWNVSSIHKDVGNSTMQQVCPGATLQNVQEKISMLRAIDEAFQSRAAPERRNCTYLGCGAYEGIGERMPKVKPSFDCPVSTFETLC